MVGGIVGDMFGGPMGAQLGSQIGGGIGGMLESLISNHGQSNVQGAMNNNMLGSLVGQLGQAIQSAPGIPQFARDEMCQALNDVQQSCPAEPTPPGCQQDTDDAMSGLIDKIVDKVVDQIMNKLQGGGCESGDFGDMLREAVEEVVREQIGGGSEDCAETNNQSQGNSSCSRSEGSGSSSTQDSRDVAQDGILTSACESEEGKEGKSGKGNWLVALAGALATVQNEFLSAAMEDMKIMEDNSAQATQSKEELEGMSDEDKQAHQEEKDQKRDEFIQAQSRYQANMQMFNMIANMTATSLKSLGEGMTAIARKQ